MIPVTQSVYGVQKRKRPRGGGSWDHRDRWLRGQDLNLRPSGYEPDELPGCSTPRHRENWPILACSYVQACLACGVCQTDWFDGFFRHDDEKAKRPRWMRPRYGLEALFCVEKTVLILFPCGFLDMSCPVHGHVAFCRPGSDLLSRVLRRSTIGAGAFHGRVRNGNGCSRPAITTRSAKRNI